MNLKFVSEKINLGKQPKRFKFGKTPVCSKCGCTMWNKEKKCCGNRISLKQYIEKVKGEVFNEGEWSFGKEVDT